MRTPVLFILDSFSGANAGTESQIVLLLNSLDRTKFEPHVVLLRGPDRISSCLSGVPVEVLDVQQLKAPGSWWKALRCALSYRRKGVGVAQIFFNDAAALFPFPLSLSGIRVAVARRDLGFWYTPSLLKLLRFSGRFVAAVVCNAEAVRSTTIEQERIPAARTTVIHNGVTRSTEVTAPSDVRSKFGIEEAAPLVGIVANLRPLKRIETAVKAIAHLARLSPAPHLVIAGADRAGVSGSSHQAEIEELAMALGVAQRVHFVGPVDDPMPLLAACDVAALCSETEGLSNSVIEYMLAGKPVLCTPVGGNSELIEEGRTGYFFEVGDDVHLARRLAELFADRVRLRQMGELARSEASFRFDPSRMVRAHEALYTHLLDRSALAMGLPSVPSSLPKQGHSTP
ncbi:glycosyltransferase family 4 protein [Peristeroidobacter agariperforans]|uniref:glycosyltransferase family 4 protein n=1 Tax=Peristeroidobacter agariperforans TaxID=268404 RepID=UPI00101CE710|nr:glycosyltransferase family 4 protein [Peristeroidobacter agariperforans]